MRNKTTAGILALLFGTYGVHRFYLGQRFKGILHFVFGIVSLMLTIEEDVPLILIPAMIGLIDSIVFFTIPRDEFDDRYNYRDDNRRHSRRRLSGAAYSKVSNPFKFSGIEKFRDYDFDGAVEDLKKALRVKYNDMMTHFYLACCYSINEDPPSAFFHLDKAVEFGFVDFEKIHSYDALAYLRTHDKFDYFVQNNYRMSTDIEAPEQTLNFKQQAAQMETLLDQLSRLGELKEKGFLSEDEFKEQKQRFLST